MVVVQYYLIPPLRSFVITRRDLPFTFTFLECQIFATWIVSKRKQTEDSLRQANAALVSQMAERERAEESLRRARSELARVVRITTVRELTASIAHEINQPLAAVVTNCDACTAWLAWESPNLVEAQTAAERAAAGATRASEVIGRTRSLIKNAPTEQIPVQLNDVITEIVGPHCPTGLERRRFDEDRSGTKAAPGPGRQNSVSAGHLESHNKRA